VFLEQGAGHFGFEDAISFAREAKERLIQFERGSVTPLVGASGADGTFAFPLASGTTWNVGAIHRTSGVAWQIGVRVERDGAPVELVLEPGVVVHGTVRDEDGAPIADASIGLDAVKKRVEGGTNSEGLGDLPTDDEGRYASPPLPVRDLLVRATKAGFLASPRTDATFAENEYDMRVDFTLKRSPRIHGRLLEPGGAPFDFARPIDRLSIHGCEQDPGTPDREYWNDALGALRPDDHGYELVPEWEGFHFIAVYAGDLLLGAAAIPEHGEGPDVVVDRSKLEARDAGKATLVLSVVDAATRESIPSFQLRHQSETFGYPDEPKTEGQLTLTGAPEKIPLPVGRHELTVRSEGYVPRRVTVDLPRGETPVEIALARADSRLTGRVLDQNDQPAAGVPVVLLGSDGRVVLPDDLGMVSTDDAGRFTFDSLASGDYLVVTGPSDAEGTSEAGLSPMSARVALRGGESSLELRLRDGVAVAFVVTTPGSETAGPLAFEIRDEAGALLVDDHRRGLWRSGSGQWWFRLPRGRHHIEVRSPGRRPAGADFTAEQGLTQRLELGPVEQ